MKLTFHWLGTRKSLSTDHMSRAADAFDAERKFLSAGKKLFNTSAPAFRQLTSVKSRATSYYKGVSLPFPEPGLRLIRQDHVDTIQNKMLSLQSELADAVVVLDAQFDELTTEASDRLGDLFDPTDYPASLAGAFQIEWSFPTVEAPEYLRRLNPELFQQRRSSRKTNHQNATVKRRVLAPLRIGLSSTSTVWQPKNTISRSPTPERFGFWSPPTNRI